MSFKQTRQVHVIPVLLFQIRLLGTTATSWNGSSDGNRGPSAGTCTLHSWNDGASEDEGDPPVGANYDCKLVPLPQTSHDRSHLRRWTFWNHVLQLVVLKVNLLSWIFGYGVPGVIIMVYGHKVDIVCIVFQGTTDVMNQERGLRLCRVWKILRNNILCKLAYISQSTLCAMCCRP